MIKTNILTNPFCVYVISFIFVFFAYSLGWSTLFPPISIQVKLFFCITFFISLLFAYPINLFNKDILFEIPNSSLNVKILVFITLGYILEFFYNKGVPLFLLLFGKDVNYVAFGIPTFHVLLHTFTSFYGIYIFHQFLSTKEKPLLIFTLYTMVPHILIINRGAVFIMLIAMLFVFLFSIKNIKIINIIGLFVVFIIVLYFFGLLGNKRSFAGDNLSFPNATNVTDRYLESKIPKEYYWTYVYMASPLANFQYNVDSKRINANIFDYLLIIRNELIPDFISKRLPDLNINNNIEKQPDLIVPFLNVSTVFTSAYTMIGWMGPFIIYFYGVILIYIFIFIVPKSSKYYITGFSILLTIMVFNTFTNMWNFSGLSFQLVYPVLGTWLNRKYLKYKYKNYYDKN